MTTTHLPRTRFRPTVAVVDLGAIRDNVAALVPAAARLMAIVKANGYGHGAVPVARAALAGGATWLGVALVEEGLELREAGIDAPILVLTEFPPGAERDALLAGLTPSLYTQDGAERLAGAALDAAPPIRVHLKIDTGMHRVGVEPSRAVEVARAAARSGLAIDGVWTHFAKSEELDDPFTGRQLAAFLAVVEDLRRAGVRPRLLHASNSGGLLAHPDAHLDLVRAGIVVYGLSPGVAIPTDGLRPALSWRSAVSLVKRVRAGDAISYGLRYTLGRDANVATVPVGYADGYMRSLGNRADVLIGGRRHRVAGTVTMDQLMVDCGDEPVQAGDDVVLIGRQGAEEVTADELGWLSGTIGYEIVCGISERVPREYIGDPDAGAAPS